MGETQVSDALAEGRSRRATWIWVAVLCVVALCGSVTASMTATVDALSNRTLGAPSHDLCGLPLTGLYYEWIHYGWLCMTALALLLGVAVPLGLVYSVCRSRRTVAALLAVLTLCLAPIPLVIQVERQSDTAGCRPL